MAYGQFASGDVWQGVNEVSRRRKEVVGLLNGALILDVAGQRAAVSYENDGRTII